MFKLFVTLLRGRAHDASQQIAERNALPLLAQQIRDAARAVETARRAVALAIAEDQAQAESAGHLADRLKDLEARAVAALEAGEDDLAREAATTIALLETEIDETCKARIEFATSIGKLKEQVRSAELRLLALQRGERIAVARDRTQRIIAEVPGNELATLDDAEETLRALRKRQQTTDLVEAAMKTLVRTGQPDAMIEKLAAAGCGAPLVTRTDDVLARLRAKVSTSAA